MIRRIVRQSITRRKRRKILSLLAITLGIAAATAVATIAVDVGDKVNRELQSVGANIVVTPAADSFPISIGGVDFRPAGSGAYLPESALPGIKKIFWRNSIEAFAPFIYVPAAVHGKRFVLIGTWFSKNLRISATEGFTTGMQSLHPGWKVDGHWPAAGDHFACLVGQQLARALKIPAGANILVTVAVNSARSDSVQFHISGILETGGEEDQSMFAPLATVQKLAGLEGEVRRVEVAAITKPVDALEETPVSRMTPKEFERWSCSNYPSTVAYQIQQVIPGSSAKPVYQITDSEGKFLNRVGLLMALLAAAALITAGLAISSMMLANVIERQAEIGLFKALGATEARVAAIFLAESSLVGLTGGVAGYILGSWLAEGLGRAVFGTPVGIHWVILPCALALALVVTLAGSAAPLGHSLKMSPATALRIE
jgi:putative ABC transport system permease protein